MMGYRIAALKAVQSSPVTLFEKHNCFEWDSHPQKGGRCFEFFQQVLRKSITNSGILISAYINSLKTIFWCFLEPKGTQVLPRQNTTYTLWFLIFKTYCCHWKAVLPSHCVQQSQRVDLKTWAEFARNPNEPKGVLFSLPLFWIWPRSWAAHRHTTVLDISWYWVRWHYVKSACVD